MRQIIHQMYEPILKISESEPSVQSIKLPKTGASVIDEATFRAIEVNRLFELVNSSVTVIGQVTLYRSLVQPLVSAEPIKAKQEALQELDANPFLRKKIEDFVYRASKNEKNFYQLLFRTFIGLGESPSSELEISGYGYEPYKRGTKFMLDLVKGVRDLPRPESEYLRGLVDNIKEFDCSRPYALMHGPVYLASGQIKTKAEKLKFVPNVKFTPTLFKPSLIAALLGCAALLIHYAPIVLDFPFFVMPALLLYVVPVSLLYVPTVGGFDRDNFIYPLRNSYRNSIEVQNALDSLGKIDELLSLHRYAKSFGTFTVLPKVTDSDKHRMILKGARNPILGKGNPEYVPNDISLDGNRLTFITGPNSGGKTALCKTIAQVQLLSQIGCYVPAQEAELSVADRIFYQAPEVSSLENEEGRFGTELKRTKDIFFYTSPKSLVILDELAEGTTYEEKFEISTNILSGFYRIGNNTILVTHNHELCEHFRRENIGQYRQVEFAEEVPTYRLVEGISRVSHADRVARKIGFAEEDIEKYLVEKGYVIQ